jgi:hypothetical protein
LPDAPWRRRALAAKLLAGAWSEFLDESALLDNLVFWLNLRDNNVDQRLLRLLRESGSAKGEAFNSRVRSLSRQLPQLDESDRERAQSAFLEGIAGREINGEDALALVSQEESARLGWRVLERAKLDAKAREALWNSLLRGNVGEGASRIAFSDATAIRVFESSSFINDRLRAWDFLARSRVPATTLREFWENAFRTAQWYPELNSFSPAAAPGLLRRAQISAETLDSWLQSWPDVIERFSPEFFLAVIEILPAATRLNLLLAGTPERWTAARAALLTWLEEPAMLGAFWQGIWEKLRGAADAQLQERLLGDAEITRTFLRISPEAFEPFLRTDEPAHEPWLLRWLEANVPGRDDEIFVLAATHQQPGVRRWGLQRARRLGVDLPLALRLMEAELPDCVALAKLFFADAPRRGDEEFDYAMALCDSPGSMARSYGREFIAARRETLLSEKLLANLAQHSEADMQAWLAEQLLQVSSPVEATQPFDRAVLRSRGRARRAKEFVQQRHEGQSETAPLDTATLLELARGRTKRDADWALRQLAQRALSGEKIEGIEVVSEVKAE